MGKLIRQKKFPDLRSEFPYFSFEGFDYKLSGEGLSVKYDFNLAGKHHFHPTLFIPRNRLFLPDETILPHLPLFLFNLGMIEMVSYWKVACPPKVIVKPAGLTGEQADWWKKIWFNGLGEFFFVNGIHTSPGEFVQFEAPGEPLAPATIVNLGLGPPIIPVGGGKDSIVTLELAGSGPGTLPLILNPRGATLETVFAKGYTPETIMAIHRSIDPLLLKLNDEGFLNGHTPFSALLAFVTVLAAMMTGRKYIALSNESSANEATIPGTGINHQYSKSYEFESAFRDYTRKYLTTAIQYFSFLRPVNELQIAKLFSQYPRYFRVFRSCNVGSKNDTWCGECAKCLFTYIILSPFIPQEEMKAIFGKDLFADETLAEYFDQLTGVSPDKPFDCVGTVDEVNAAVSEVIRQRAGQELPFLLGRYVNATPELVTPGEFHALLRSFSKSNFLPRPFEEKLLAAVIS
jgi:UDP-N-acetyl-alpha-D-muramoyl-L-alanyl-L-glutamate epimerase